MVARLLVCFAAASLPCTNALRRATPYARSGGGAIKQELTNIGDVSYLGEISVGGQALTGVLDTGSFELVVFSKACTSCGTAGQYNESASSTYERGGLTQEHAYGSGACTAVDGFDTVEVGSLHAAQQSLWSTTSCDMPILKRAKFHAIVGIGPPGQPEWTAQQDLEEMEQDKQNFEINSMSVPDELNDQIDKKKQELEVAKSKPAMLENFGVTTFSQCLGKQPKSPGWLIWNDSTRWGTPGVKRVPISGKITWGTSATNLAFASSGLHDIVACKQGCGAIIDTGTSLFAVPSEVYESIFNAVDRYMHTRLPPDMPAGCDDLSYFPDLVVNLGGQDLSFPPSSYIGSFYGQMDKEVAGFVRQDSIRGSKCQLLIMDLGETEVTTLGSMIILGMPFFREYYTTFDLGNGGAEGRSLFLSEADDTCQPASEGVVSNQGKRGVHANTPRQVDASQLRVPKRLLNLKGKL